MLVAFGWILAASYLTRGQEWDTQSAWLMPFPLLAYPLLLNFASMIDIYGKIDLRPKIEVWCVFTAALAASYLVSLLPKSALEATILSIVISTALWLVSVQVTRRPKFVKWTKQNIAKRTGMPEGNPEVRRLANNDDLPKAMVAAVLITIQVWLLLNSPEFAGWLPKIISGPDQEFTTGSARTASFMAGALTGHLYHRYCPNQTEIREIGQQTKPISQGNAE